MERFCKSIREHVKNIINSEKKKMLLLTKEELKSHHYAKLCFICGKEPYKSSLGIKVIKMLGIFAIMQVNIEAHHIVLVL